MSVFYIKANLYNFEPWNTEFEVEDAKFYVDTNSKVREKFKKEIKPQITGYVELKIENTHNCDKAIEIAKNKLERYSKAMSFAQGHDVYFNNFSCYEFLNGIKTIRQETTNIVRVGKIWGSGIVYIPHITDFLMKSIPKLLDDEFIEDTGIDRALDWYNISRSFKIVDNLFITLFISLEILANSLADYQDKTHVLTIDERKVLKKEFHDLVKYKLKIEPRCRRSVLYSNMSGIDRVTIANRIKKLLTFYDLSSYSKYIKEILNIRNLLFHGKKIDHRKLDIFNVADRLEKIVEKIFVAEFEINERLLYPDTSKIFENGGRNNARV